MRYSSDSESSLPSSRHESQLYSIVCLAVVSMLALCGCATMDAISSAVGPRELQLQLFLDAQGFGPGVVDGRAGEFTEKGLAFYRKSQGLAPGSHVDIGTVQPYTSYTLTDGDLAQIGPMAATPEELAKLKR